MLTEIRPKNITASLMAWVALALSSSILVPLSRAGFGQAQATTAERAETDEEVKETILKLEHDKVEALKQGGSAIADWEDRVFADDLVCMGSGFGGVCTKAQMVAEHRSGERKLRTVHHDDYGVRVYGNTAVLTFRGDNIMERKGKILTGVVRTTDVYVKQDGLWRIVAHLVTPVQTQ